MRYYFGFASIVLISLVVVFSVYRDEGDICPDVVEAGEVDDRIQQLWQAGEVVVLIRHTDKCKKDKPCAGNRGLTPKGEIDAKRIGQGMRLHLDNNFELFSSKVERAITTAQLAFQRMPIIVPWLREECKQDLQAQLLQSHRGNQVMVTHSTCLGVLTNEEGEKLIPFKPAGRANYGLAVFLQRKNDTRMPEVLGCAWPADWSSPAND